MGLKAAMRDRMRLAGRPNMNDRSSTNHQLPLWDAEPTNPSPVILTNEQYTELAAALAELLLIHVPATTYVAKGADDAK
jgi:hypothetical protein